MLAPIGNFAEAWPVLKRSDLVAPVVATALSEWSAVLPEIDQVLVVNTDLELADTANFCEAYDVAPENSANCVVVGSGRRQGNLIVPGSVLSQLPGAEVLSGLGVSVIT